MTRDPDEDLDSRTEGSDSNPLDALLGRLERQGGNLDVLSELLAGSDESETAPTPPPGAVPSTARDRLPGLPFGSETFEHYEVVDLLGEGGMGSVYDAVDTRLGRRVALKTLHRTRLWSDDARGRFLREARILSSLDHPHICRMYEYIEGEDADYLAMERVEGRTLKEILREGAPPPAVARAAARQIASALAAAHERGIVHRDIKPENAMVSADGHVKVLDFGISRPSDDLPEEADRLRVSGAPSSDTTPTKTGALIGTPAYMSPEQVRGESLTTASDVFSLGLVFHELFCGERAWRESASLPELLETRKVGGVRPALGLAPELQKLVEAMKHADPGTRPTAAEVVRRLEAFEEKPKLEAAARRRRLALGTLAATTLLFAGLAWRLDRALETARQETRKAEAVAGFLEDLLLLAKPGERYGEEPTVREILEAGTQRIGDALPEDPLGRARVLRTLARVLRLSGDLDRAEELVVDALRILDRAPGRSLRDELLVRGELASIARLRRDWEEAEVRYRRLLDLARTAASETLELSATTHLASLADRDGRTNEADAGVARARELLERIPDEERATSPVTDSLYTLAGLRAGRGDRSGGIALLQEALALQAASPRPDMVDRAIYLDLLADLVAAEGRLDRALELLEESLDVKRRTIGDLHRQTIVSRVRIAQTLARAGRPLDAIETFETLLGDLDRVGAEDSPEAASSRIGLASALRSVGGHLRAEEILLSILDRPGLREHLGGQIEIVHNNLGSLYADMGRYAEAEAIYREAWERRETLPRALTAIQRNNLAEICRRTDRTAEAVALYQEALELGTEEYGPDHYAVADMRRGLAIALADGGELERARQEAEQALSTLEAGVGPAHPVSVSAALLVRELGISAAPEGAPGSPIDARLRRRVESLGPELAQLREPIERLAAALRDRGRHDEAEEVSSWLPGSGIPPASDSR